MVSYRTVAGKQQQLVGNLYIKASPEIIKGEPSWFPFVVNTSAKTKHVGHGLGIHWMTTFATISVIR
jgi:hypothetical protein